LSVRLRITFVCPTYKNVILMWSISKKLVKSIIHHILNSKPGLDVILRDAYKEDNSIVIKWESETSQILGFRVVYRLFGKPEFKQGPPLAPSEREFRIKNVPTNVRVKSSGLRMYPLKLMLNFFQFHRNALLSVLSL
jgi:hypothetical protein